jgi:hypothetical protein
MSLLIISQTISKACIDKLYVDLAGFSVNQATTNKDKIDNINVFLNRVASIFDQKVQITSSNWKMIGRYLITFARMYHTLLTESCSICIEHQMRWTSYLCTGQYKPLRILYRLLGFIGVLYTDCKYFYIYDKANNWNETQFLSLNSILANLYNPFLRLSKKNTKNCIDRLAQSNIDDISHSIQYIEISLNIRRLFLTGKYCGGYIKNVESDPEHDFFKKIMQNILNQLHTLLEVWNNDTFF